MHRCVLHAINKKGIKFKSEKSLISFYYICKMSIKKCNITMQCDYERKTVHQSEL